ISETNDFVGSWVAYERMVAAGIGPASLDELLGRAAVPAVPSRDTTRAAAQPASAAPPARAPAAPALEVVDIKRLVYRGQRALAGRPLPLAAVWDAVAIGFMANNLLPARAGEFARAWVASRNTPVRFTTALGSIGVERVFDGLTMLGLMAVAIAAPSFPRDA